nr:RT-like putative protein [Naviculales sp.]
MKGLERLSVVRDLSRRPGWKHKELFRILRKDDIWIAAYENLKGLTPGVRKETLDGTSLIRLQKIQSKVLDEKYRFKPVKQTWIPKANGKQRLLGLPSPEDKIVQEVIRMILEAIYEPIFDTRSFGFRGGVGVHNALQYVEKEFRWVDWVIKGDIKNVYPTIEHNTLCDLLRHKIEDERFMNLIRKSLKCGVYINPETLYSKLGVPQGSIVSPILENIYYHELDKWITEKGKELYSEKFTLRHPDYKRLEYQIGKLNKQLDQTERNSTQRNNLIREIKALIQQRNQTPSLLDKGIKIRYARYADDWIIGIRGPKGLAKQIKEDVDGFLQTHLKQPIKTQIINIRAGKFSFLGYEIFLPRNMKLVKYKKKDGPPNLRFQVPIDTVLKRLKEHGYIAYKKHKVRPVSKRGYTPLEDKVIVNHFKSVWTGLLNFYSGTTNWSHLQYVHYLLHMSCAMTLAHRHRSTSKKIFKKHGKRLEIKDKKAETLKVIAYFPYRTSWKVSDRKWQIAKSMKDPFTI